jgi:hypothetical protein
MSAAAYRLYRHTLPHSSFTSAATGAWACPAGVPSNLPAELSTFAGRGDGLERDARLHGAALPLDNCEHIAEGLAEFVPAHRGSAMSAPPIS